VSRVGFSLGAEHIGLRIGYASLGVTVSKGPKDLTRMHKVGAHGVNQKMIHQLRLLVKKVEEENLGVAQIREEFSRLDREVKRYPMWVCAIAVGSACAAFGRLLGIDWASFFPVLIAATLGQALRVKLLGRGVNSFLVAALIAFGSSLLSAAVSRWVGSQTVETAAIASILLLVPGVPALNALQDTLEGRPTLGCARAITVMVTLIFATSGLWLAQSLLSKLP